MGAWGSYEPLDVERIVWGRPLAAALAAELSFRGAERPLLVVSPSCRRQTTVVDQLLAELPKCVGVFDRIATHVPRDNAMDLVHTVRLASADIIVTVGGGSTIDTVKVALAGLAAGVGCAADFERLGIKVAEDGARTLPKLQPPPIRQVCAPTTLSGAEFSDLAGCTDPVTMVKQLITGPAIGSATVILDPAITLSTPVTTWLSTGVRALDHAVESLCSVASNPFVDATATAAVARLDGSLRRTHADPSDLDARLQSQLGVWLACSGLNRVPLGASHGLGHQLGAVAGVPHGYCSCILLPHVLAFNRPVNGDRQALLEQALGDGGRTAGEAVADLVQALRLPQRLRDVGVEREMLPVIARTSMGNMFVRQNPRPIESPDDLLSILEAAF